MRRRHSAVYASEDGGLGAWLMDSLSQSPIIINRAEVMDPERGLLSVPSGVTVTGSGYLGLAIVAVQQLFAPWGIVKYSKRLKEDEQAWLDLGKSPEQAVINAYNNARPPRKSQEDEAAPDDDAIDGEQKEAAAGTESEVAGETK